MILLVMTCYFSGVMILARWTARRADNATFFTGNRQSPWWLVSFGMIGASLSGVTFISVPGWVEGGSMAYMQMVLGYVVGYAVVSYVLLPLYYRHQHSSIYGYLGDRFGLMGQKSGAWLFLLSRWVGASLRLFLVAEVLQTMMFGPLGIPYPMTVIIIIALIWLYTHQGGIKTVVYTDVLQTVAMLTAIVLAIMWVGDAITMRDSILSYVFQQPESQWFFWDVNQGNYFWKQFLAGMFITITMTGLDQDMMQKNLTCRSLKEAQRNVMSLSAVLVLVNFVVLSLGVLLLRYAEFSGIEDRGDALFAAVVMSPEMPMALGLVFVIGLIAAAFSSADSALTSLTTSLSVDVLHVESMDHNRAQSTRRLAHVVVSFAVFLLIVCIRPFADPSIIKTLFTAAGYTYGPLLGMFALGMMTQRVIKTSWVIPAVAISSPLLTYALKYSVETWSSYVFSFELLLVNGIITFVLLWLSSKRDINA